MLKNNIDTYRKQFPGARKSQSLTKTFTSFGQARIPALQNNLNCTFAKSQFSHSRRATSSLSKVQNKKVCQLLETKESFTGSSNNFPMGKVWLNQFPLPSSRVSSDKLKKKTRHFFDIGRQDSNRGDEGGVLGTKKVNHQQNFFNKLKPTSVFFCPACFQYVFKIEHMEHRPLCKNIVSAGRLSDQQKWKLGWEKMQLVLNLSQYVKYKEQAICRLFNTFQKRQVAEMDRITQLQQQLTEKLSEPCKFMRLEDIELALLLIYKQFIQAISDKAVKNKSAFKLTGC